MASTIDELRTEAAKWRREGNDGTGIVVSLVLAEKLIVSYDRRLVLEDEVSQLRADRRIR